MKTFTLTQDQKAAYDFILRFITNTKDRVLVLKGHAGTGKTTLIKEVLKGVPQVMTAKNLITQKNEKWDTQLTATTHKAVEAFHDATGEDVVTIHSYLGLKVEKDMAKGTTSLEPTKRTKHIANTIVFIDEGSYLDSRLIDLIIKHTTQSKVIIMGDPSQLTPVGHKKAPAFSRGYPEVELTEVVRQAKGSPIEDLASKFRGTVKTGEFFSFTPDGITVKHLSGADYEQAVFQEFNRTDWKHDDSKILAWTNRRVIDYNQAITERVTGNAEFQVDDYVIVNEYISSSNGNYRSGQIAKIAKISPGVSHEVMGYHVTLGESVQGFLPQFIADKKDRIKAARKAGDTSTLVEINETWFDLRASYACTINKAQGSTYKKVFIDLDDIRKCNNPNQIARMLYVATSRAKDQVIFKGDIV